MNSLSTGILLFIVAAIVAPQCTTAFVTNPTPKQIHPKLHPKNQNRARRTLISIPTTSLATASSPSSSSGAGAPDGKKSFSSVTPTTFREGEVLGLRLMQDGQCEEAIKVFKKALTLPGSRSDIIRTANVAGPSPVGGSKGGTEGRAVQTLDEFEYQAAHYNMACAYASLGDVSESVANLRKAFEYGFDNYGTVRADPDLATVRESAEFARLMDEFDPKFNPFGVFGK